MYQDLHSHTYYSFCGRDDPEELVKTAIDGGIEMLGITDHSYGIGFARPEIYRSPFAEEFASSYGNNLEKYFGHMSLLRDKYGDRIDIKIGVEVCTLANDRELCHAMPVDTDISYFDFSLIEHLDSEVSITGGNLFGYAKHLDTPLVGIAHTDMFAFIARRGKDPLDYFRRMAENGIFWEMNVNYDSIHGFKEHPYMLEFFSNPYQQEIVAESGVRVSVGFDSHRLEDYLPGRIKYYCDRLESLGIKKPYED